jgi:hypothetical protein
LLGWGIIVVVVGVVGWVPDVKGQGKIRCD